MIAFMHLYLMRTLKWIILTDIQKHIKALLIIQYSVVDNWLSEQLHVTEVCTETEYFNDLMRNTIITIDTVVLLATELCA